MGVINEIGHKYSRLTVIERVGSDKQGNATWLCECECNNQTIVRGKNLRNSNTKSCGNCIPKEMIGHKFGRLTVIERAGSNIRRAKTWLCECECGNQIVIAGDSLRRGNTKSCGCLWRERVSLPEGEAAFNWVFSQIKHNAKRRGYAWQLTKEQVRALTKQVCFYCGTEPRQGIRRQSTNGIYLYNGLDRVDNSRGYTISNVVPCCGTCNRAKKALATEQFKIWVCNIYENFAKTSDY